MYWESYRNDLYAALRAVDPVPIYALAEHLYACRNEGRTVFICGNGGSAANASHLAQDLSKGTEAAKHGKPLRALSLCDSVAAITAWANDQDYAVVFERQLANLGRAGDVLLAISGSGNSQNVLLAVDWANRHDLRTWGITGFDGGKLLRLAHRCVHVPCDDMGMVEAAHSAISHWLVAELRAMFRGEQGGLSIMDSSPL